MLPASVFCHLPPIAAVPLAEERKKFEGSWKVVEFVAMGVKVDPGKGAPESATIKNGVLDFSSQGQRFPR